MTAAVCMLVAACGAETVPDREPFEQRIPGFLVRFRMMPIPDGEIEIEGGRHPIRNLYVSETEVTWDLFETWAFQLDLTDEQRVAGVDAEARPSRPYGDIYRGFGHIGYPAIGMTHEAAEGFCRWLSGKTGRKYRLPTLAEWRYAARAGQQRLPDLSLSAWAWEDAMDKTHPVGKKQANPWGLYDMLGNVAEWVRLPGDEYAVCGGSFRDKREGVSWRSVERQTPRWNETDPQQPKSRWWLSDAPFVGIRLVCEG